MLKALRKRKHPFTDMLSGRLHCVGYSDDLGGCVVPALLLG